MLRKTAGLVDVVRDALHSLNDRIDAAFIDGSMASGRQSSRSDVDVMIIGELPFADAVRALAPAQDELRREVNPTVMNLTEFKRKRRAKDSFVTEVWKSPKLWVIGGERELG